MFEAIVERRDTRNRRVARLLVGSLGLHGVVLVGVVGADQLRVPRVPEPTVTVTFVDFASLPPPPPPPPPPKKRHTPKKVETRPVEPTKELMAPREIPTKEEPPPEKPEEGEESGSDDGEEGGVEGGVAGGVVGGVLTQNKAPPRPVPEAPPQPVQLDQNTVRKRRIRGSDPEYPRVALSREIEATLVARIKIGLDGSVVEVHFEKTHALFERTVREAIASWRFSPHLVNGRPVPVITRYKFVFQLQ